MCSINVIFLCQIDLENLLSRTSRYIREEFLDKSMGCANNSTEWETYCVSMIRG